MYVTKTADRWGQRMNGQSLLPSRMLDREKKVHVYRISDRPKKFVMVVVMVLTLHCKPAFGKVRKKRGKRESRRLIGSLASCRSSCKR
jgi:hypothetical protein